MTEIFNIQVAPDRIIKVQANSPEEAAAGARKVIENESRGYSDNLARSFGQGATFGFGDELTAGVRAVVPGFANWMMRGPELQRTPEIGGSPEPQTVSTAPTFAGRYEDELQKERDAQKGFEETNPKAALAAKMAGGAATVALGGVAGLPVAPAMGPGLGGNILRMGAAGAAYGGVQGFGEGEGGFENRLATAAPAAAFGGAAGAAAPIAGAGGQAIAESPIGQWVAQKLIAPVANRFAAAVEGQPMRSLSAAAPDGNAGGPITDFAQAISNPTQSGAIDRIATAIQRSGLSPQQLEQRLQQLGPEAMLADLDPQFMRQARMANTMPGDTSSYAKVALEGRDRQAGNRIVSAFEGDQPPPSSYDFHRAAEGNLQGVGQRAYGAMEAAGLKQTPELIEIQGNPIVSRAIDAVMKAEQETRVGTGRAPASPVEIMHKVKQAIWDMGFDANTARPGPNASFYRDLGTEYVNRLKAANPALAEADKAYAQAASLPEYFETGRSFLGRGTSEKATNASAPGLADLLAKAEPQQVLAARSGATNAARETALEGTPLARVLARRIDESTPVRDKLVELYGPKQADQIMKRASAERTFAETSNDILRGSKTADKTADVLDNAGIRVSSGGVSPRLWERFVDLASRMTGPNEQVRNQIGRMTLTPDAERNAEVLRLAFEQLRRRQSGRPLAAALAGSGGSSLAGP